MGLYGTAGVGGVGSSAEIFQIENRQRRRKRIRALTKQVRQEVAANVKDLRRTYPWMAPEVVYSIANAGHDASAPLAVKAADVAAGYAARTGRWSRSGESADNVPAPPRLTPQEIKAQWQWLDNPKKARRQAREEFLGQEFKPGVSIGDVQEANRRLPPGAAPLRPVPGGSGLGPVTDVLDEINPFEDDKYGGGAVSGETLRRATEEYLPPDVGAGLRGVSRSFMLGAQAPLDLVHAAIRDTANRVSGISEGRAATVVGQNLSDPFAVVGNESRVPLWKQSQAFRAAEAAVEGREVDVGDGWFPDPESRTGRAAAESARQAAPTIGGHAFTLGRYIANQAFDPDSVPFDIASGFVDAVIAIKADPTNPAFDQWTAARRQGKTFAVADEMQNVVADASRRAQDLATQARLAPDDLDLASLAREARATEADLIHEAAGVYGKGHRPWTSPKTFLQWAQTAGRDAVGQMTRTTDPYEIRQMFKGKGSREFWNEAAAASTPEETIGVLSRYAGGEVRDIPKYQAFKPLDNQRWAQMAPTGRAASPDRPEEAIEEADRWARNVKMTPEARKAAVSPFFTAKSYDDYEDAMEQLMRSTADTLVEQENLPRDIAESLTRWETQRNRLWRKFGVTSTGDNIDTPFAIIGEDGVVQPSAQLPTELLSHGVPFPDFRAVRRATKLFGNYRYKLRGVAQDALTKAADSLPEDDPLRLRIESAANDVAFDLKSPHTGKDIVQSTSAGARSATKAVAKAADRFGSLAAAAERAGHSDIAGRLRLAQVVTSASGGADWMHMAAGSIIEAGGNLWRRSKLARLAWGLRVVGEEQARLWAYGMVGAFNHPITAAAIVAGHNPDGKFASALSRFGVEPALVADVKGGLLGDTDEVLDALNGRVFGDIYTDAAEIRGPSVDLWGTAARGEGTYNGGVVEELARLAKDPAAKHLAGLSKAEQRAYLTEDPVGVKLWNDKIARPNRMARFNRDQTERKLIGEMNDVEKSQLMDFYLDGLNERIDVFTAGDTRIRDAIRDGAIGDVKIKLKQNGSPDDDYVAEVERLLTEGGWSGPAKVRVRDSVVNPDAVGHLAGWGAAFDTFMWNLMPRPSNWLSRSPMFRQTYWKRVGELAPGMDPKALYKMYDSGIRASDSAGWKAPDELVGLRGVRGTPGGLSLDDVDQLAKAHALQTTKDVLYDLSERGQLFDVLKAVVPFGEAWKEVLTRWGRAVWENPKVVHRLDQGITSAREQGWLHKGQFGDEVLTLPGSTWLTDKIIGVPVGIDQSLQGTNIVGNVWPGVGPALSLPLPYLARALNVDIDQPGAMREVMNIVYPYGRNDEGLPEQDILNQILPTSVARGLKFWDANDPSVQSTAGYFMSYLAATGKYDLHGQRGKDPTDEMRRLVDDALSKARQFQIIRAFGSFSLPSAPIPKYHLVDPDNRMMEARVAVEHYYKWAEEEGYDKAMERWVERFGEDNAFFLQAATDSEGRLNLPRTRKQADWMIDREYLRDNYGDVYGLLVPPDAKGKFDFAEHQAQINRGEKKRLSLDDRAALANSRLAYYVRNRAIKRGASDDQLDALDDDLRRDFPGYDPDTFVIGQRDKQIAQITQMVNDKRVTSDSETKDVARMVRIYLEGRRRIIEMQQSDEYGSTAKSSVSTAESVKPLRDKLRALAKDLGDDEPRFRLFWRLVFRKELKD